MSEPFLAFVECAGCGEAFHVRNRMALNRAKWCSEKCRKGSYGQACVDCGARTTHGAEHGKHDEPRCKSCSNKHRGALARQQVEELWAQGKTGREIARIMGWTSKNPSTVLCALRNAHGYNLPRRYPDARIAQVVRDGMSLARARSVRADALLEEPRP